MQTNDGLSNKDITDEQAREIVQTLYDGDFNLTSWEVDFINDNTLRSHFSRAQRILCFQLAMKYKIPVSSNANLRF